MFRKYLEKEASAFSKNMKANLNALFNWPKIDILAILDYFWMICKTIIVVLAITTVIGIVQKPGKDASIVYTLQSNHEEMVADED